MDPFKKPSPAQKAAMASRLESGEGVTIYAMIIDEPVRIIPTDAPLLPYSHKGENVAVFRLKEASELHGQPVMSVRRAVATRKQLLADPAHLADDKLIHEILDMFDGRILDQEPEPAPSVNPFVPEPKKPALPPPPKRLPPPPPTLKS